MTFTVNKSQTLSVQAGFWELVENAVIINDTDLLTELVKQYEDLKNVDKHNVLRRAFAHPLNDQAPLLPSALATAAVLKE